MWSNDIKCEHKFFVLHSERKGLSVAAGDCSNIPVDRYDQLTTTVTAAN